MTEVDVTQTYCDQNITEISIVHTINNWHASCTRNLKNPLASTYNSLNTENWFFQTINLPNPWRVIWCKLHHPSKFLNKRLISNPIKLVQQSFDQEKLIAKKVTFHDTHCPLKKLKHKNMQLLDNMYLTIQKHWQR